MVLDPGDKARPGRVLSIVLWLYASGYEAERELPPAREVGLSFLFLATLRYMSCTCTCALRLEHLTVDEGGCISHYRYEEDGPARAENPSVR